MFWFSRWNPICASMTGVLRTLGMGCKTRNEWKLTRKIAPILMTMIYGNSVPPIRERTIARRPSAWLKGSSFGSCNITETQFLPWNIDRLSYRRGYPFFRLALRVLLGIHIKKWFLIMLAYAHSETNLYSMICTKASGSEAWVVQKASFLLWRTPFATKRHTIYLLYACDPSKTYLSNLTA